MTADTLFRLKNFTKPNDVPNDALLILGVKFGLSKAISALEEIHRSEKLN